MRVKRINPNIVPERALKSARWQERFYAFHRQKMDEARAENRRLKEALRMQLEALFNGTVLPTETMNEA